MSSTQKSAGKPFLRVLKLAYKLHQAGATEPVVVNFISAAQCVAATNGGEGLPSASAPVDVIVADVFNALDTDTQNRYGNLFSTLARQLGYDVQEAVC